MADEALERRLAIVEDRIAIHDVLMRYCRGVDRGDPALIHSAFFPDATDNHFGIVIPYTEALGTLKNPVNDLTVRHNLCNEYVELDGDVAHGEAYFIMTTRIEPELDWHLEGRYVDRFERRNGEWRIAERSVVYDLQRFEPVPQIRADLGAGRFIDKALRGANGTADFSYRQLTWGGKPR